MKLIIYKETLYLTCAFSSFHTSFVFRIVFAWILRFQIVHAVLMFFVSGTETIST